MFQILRDKGLEAAFEVTPSCWFFKVSKSVPFNGILRTIGNPTPQTPGFSQKGKKGAFKIIQCHSCVFSEPESGQTYFVQAGFFWTALSVNG